MSVKYKIENSKKNKNLIGDEVSVSKIKKPGGRGGKKRKSTRDLLVEFMDKQDKFNQNMITRFDNLVKLNNLKE